MSFAEEPQATYSPSHTARPGTDLGSVGRCELFHLYQYLGPVLGGLHPRWRDVCIGKRERHDIYMQPSALLS
jgi:hypothetical protein